MTGVPPRLSLDQFSAAALALIGREHTAARAFGISFPEILWPRIVLEVLPELAGLSVELRAEFIWQQVQLLRAVSLAPGAAEGLRILAAREIPLGLASNAQAYTLQELESGLGGAGLPRRIFKANLSFFSYENGFSKPDPHVFRLLTTRLQLAGILPEEILMIGNRLDNDIGPAKAQGWQTWHYTEEPSAGGAGEGDWAQLMRWLTPRL
jgi:putative hydrolase of the HAD superfamily